MRTGIVVGLGLLLGACCTTLHNHVDACARAVTDDVVSIASWAPLFETGEFPADRQQIGAHISKLDGRALKVSRVRSVRISVRQAAPSLDRRRTEKRAGRRREDLPTRGWSASRGLALLHSERPSSR